MNFISYFNPFSKEHHSVSEFKNLGFGERAVTITLTALLTIASIPIFGLGGVAMFRFLTRKFTPIKLEQPSQSPVENTAKKTEEIRRSTMEVETIAKIVESITIETIEVTLEPKKIEPIQIPEIHDETPLAKKVIERWKKFTADRKNARGCPLAASPESHVLKTKIFAVHATDIMPDQNRLLAGSLFAALGQKTFLKPTLHFALGSLVPAHRNGSWEDKKYAVIAPLGKITSKLVSLFPHDTCVLGDVEMDEDFTMLVPEGEEVPQSRFRVTTYLKQTTLRAAIDEIIQKQGGWKLGLSTDGGGASASATIEHFPQGIHDGCQPTFFQKLLDEDPLLSFGPVASTFHRGEAWRFTSLDSIASDLFLNYLNYSKMGDLQKCRTVTVDKNYLTFLSKWISHHLPILEDLVSKKFPNITIESFERFKKEMTILLYLINLDLHLTGYAYNPPMMIQSNNPELEAWLREKVDLLRKQESISFDKFSEEETNKAKSFLDEKKSVHIDSFKRHKQRDEMSSMCSNLSEKEFQIFLKKGQSIIFPDEVIFDFYRLYYRWTQYGNPEDKTAFIDYVQKNAEGVEYYFGDRTNYWIPTEIRSLEKSLVNAPATRKALIEDVIRELKNRE